MSGAAHWLPDLDAGQVGGLAFFVVCGLLGVDFAVVGLHTYSIAEELHRYTDGPNIVSKAELLSEGLSSLLWEAGLILGIAAMVYLLAPASEFEDETPEFVATASVS